MSFFRWVIYSLVIIGALNWGLIGAFNFDLVSFFFGDMTYLTRTIYTLVGLSALGYLIFSLHDRLTCEDCGC